MCVISSPLTLSRGIESLDSRSRSRKGATYSNWVAVVPAVKYRGDDTTDRATGLLFVFAPYNT